MSRLYFLTAERGKGKTTFCRAIAESAHLKGWKVAGLLSPAVFVNDLKTGILAEDLCTHESRRLASTTRQSPQDISLGMWYFDSHTLEWGNHILESCLPCDLLIIDELGPLEFLHKQGWQSALEILNQRQYRIALVVMRPELIKAAQDFYPDSQIIQFDSHWMTPAGIEVFMAEILAVS